jgi:chromate reductase
MSKKIIAFSTSNSSKSINKQLATIAGSYIKDASLEVIDLNDYPAGIYGADEEEANGIPEGINALKEKMATADGYLVSTAEHNGFIPAVFKNSLDWLSRTGGKVFNEKPAVFLSSSPGARGGASALGQLLAVMPHQGATVIGGHSVGSFFDKVEAGDLKAGEDKEKVKALIAELEAAL